MPINKTSSGIFQNVSITGPLRKAEMKAIRELFKVNSLSEDLDYYEKEARRIVEIHERKYIKLPDLSNEWKLVVEDARRILMDISLLRKALAQQNAEQAATHALQLGHLLTKMQVRPHEPAAQTGRRVRRIAADGRQSEGLRLAKQRKHQQQKQWTQCANEYRAQHPGCFAADAYRHVVKKFKETEFEVKFGAVKQFLQKKGKV